MTNCKTCGKSNPAEIHTCTPGLHFTEHEKLKEICNKIGYKVEFFYIKTSMGISKISVREIIFTPGFRHRLEDLLLETNSESQVKFKIENLMWDLKDPTTYLYNLIK